MRVPLFESEIHGALGHRHALHRASSVHPGFTGYMFCDPTALKAAYGPVFTPLTADFGVHGVITTLCFLSHVYIIMVSRSTQFVPSRLWNLRPVSFLTTKDLAVGDHQALESNSWEAHGFTHGCAVTPLRAQV